ncbi:MAG: endonuclease/exonuclease/phosphatase family protein [Pseudomonadota bacterium]
MDYRNYPDFVAEDIIRLRRRLRQDNLPPRRTDHNFILGTWNIRSLGGYFDAWTENPDSPKRNLRGLAMIAEVIQHFDVVAIQEVKRETTALRLLAKEFLGPTWDVMMSDVTAGDKGNTERSAYLYDTRRVQPSGLAGEIVLPPTVDGDPQEQVDSTPYLVGFNAGGERFALLTAHIRYGEDLGDRIPELRRLAQYTAEEIRDRSRFANAEEANLIVLGDFNTDRDDDNDLFEVFLEQGLWVPEELRNLKTTYGQEAKHYDQIAWFRDDMTLLPTGRAGVVDFAGAVFQELTPFQMTFRVSDHFPLWCEFSTDRSTETIAGVLGVDPDSPDPFGGVAD